MIIKSVKASTFDIGQWDEMRSSFPCVFVDDILHLIYRCIIHVLMLIIERRLLRLCPTVGSSIQFSFNRLQVICIRVRERWCIDFHRVVWCCGEPAINGMTATGRRVWNAMHTLSHQQHYRHCWLWSQIQQSYSATQTRPLPIFSFSEWPKGAFLLIATAMHT